MAEQLVLTTIDLIWKQLLLRSVVERILPNVRSPILKAIIGLIIRLLHYKIKDIIDNGLFDEYCDLPFVEYIILPKMTLCKYRSYIEHGMKWFLDFVNRILAEDGIKQSIDRMQEQMHGMQEQMHGMHGDIQTIKGDIKNIHLQLQPERQLQLLLTREDLRHE